MALDFLFWGKVLNIGTDRRACFLEQQIFDLYNRLRFLVSQLEKTSKNTTIFKKSNFSFSFFRIALAPEALHANRRARWKSTLRRGIPEVLISCETACTQARRVLSSVFWIRISVVTLPGHDTLFKGINFRHHRPALRRRTKAHTLLIRYKLFHNRGLSQCALVEIHCGGTWSQQIQSHTAKVVTYRQIWITNECPNAIPLSGRKQSFFAQIKFPISCMAGKPCNFGKRSIHVQGTQGENTSAAKQQSSSHR